jgi:hypothetical protein
MICVAENLLKADCLNRRIMENRMPAKYEEKFAGLIRLCNKAKSEGVDRIIIAWPDILGDTYDEVIESLSRIADAGMMVCIAGRKDPRLSRDDR